MDATTLTLIGCAFGLIALLIALSQLYPAAIGRKPGVSPPPWAPWSASTQLVIAGAIAVAVVSPPPWAPWSASSGSGAGSAHESRRKPTPAEPTPRRRCGGRVPPRLAQDTRARRCDVVSPTHSPFLAHACEVSIGPQRERGPTVAEWRRRARMSSSCGGTGSRLSIVRCPACA